MIKNIQLCWKYGAERSEWA